MDGAAAFYECEALSLLLGSDSPFSLWSQSWRRLFGRPIDGPVERSAAEPNSSPVWWKGKTQESHRYKSFAKSRSTCANCTAPPASSSFSCGDSNREVIPLPASADWNLKLFQMRKSPPSTVPSTLKSPWVHAEVDVNLFPFQVRKSPPSIVPSRLASPKRYGLREGKLAAPAKRQPLVAISDRDVAVTGQIKQHRIRRSRHNVGLQHVNVDAIQHTVVIEIGVRDGRADGDDDSVGVSVDSIIDR